MCMSFGPGSAVPFTVDLLPLLCDNHQALQGGSWACFGPRLSNSLFYTVSNPGNMDGARMGNITTNESSLLLVFVAVFHIGGAS